MRRRLPLLILLLAAALLRTPHPVAAEDPAAAETFPGERLILERLAAKGIPEAQWPARDAADPAASRLALGRFYVDRLGIGDRLRDAQRFFAPGGPCDRVVPTLRAEVAEAAAFLARPVDLLVKEAEKVPRHADLLRAAWAVWPLVVEPERRETPGTWRVAPPDRWLLLEVAPALKGEAEACFAVPGASFRRFLESDALRTWLDTTVTGNARTAAIAFWPKVLETLPANEPLRTRIPAALLRFAVLPLPTLFGPRWSAVTPDTGLDRLPWALLALSLTRRGRSFLEDFLPLVAAGRLTVATHESTTSTGQYSQGRLAIDFAQSPACSIDTLMHEGVHALDDLGNGTSAWWKEVGRRVDVDRAGILALAQQAAGAEDTFALERYAARWASLEAQVADLRTANQAETEFLAWHASTDQDSEAMFLVVTDTMVSEEYLMDRDRLEGNLTGGAGYRMEPGIVEEMFRARDWDAPEEILRAEGWKRFPEVGIPLSLTSAGAWQKLGDAYRSLGRPAEASAAYDRALALDRECAGAHAGRARLLRERGEWEAALAEFGRALARAPGDADVLLARGETWEQVGADSRALADYGLAIQARGKDVRPWLARARLRLRRDEAREALEDLTEVVALEPAWAEGWRLRAEAFLRVGERAKAAADLDRARRLADAGG